MTEVLNSTSLNSKYPGLQTSQVADEMVIFRQLELKHIEDPTIGFVEDEYHTFVVFGLTYLNLSVGINICESVLESS